MPKTRRMLTNFSKGELSPLIEGRPDLAAFFEGGKTIENWLLMRQGGLIRAPGTRFICEVKDSTKDTILLPFEFSVNDAYILEVGAEYLRFIKNKAQLLDGPPVEVASPYLEADLRTIHFTQSADVLWLFHGSYPQQRVSRVSDLDWTLAPDVYNPPPSFQADTDLATPMGISANSGNGRRVRAATGVFLAGDIGRQLIAGAGVAVITGQVDAFEMTVDVLTPFNQTITAGPATMTTVGTAMTSTAHGLSAGHWVTPTSGAQAGEIRRVAAIVDADHVTLDAAFPADIGSPVTWNKVIGVAASNWVLRLSPQVTLQPNIKEPIGAQITLVAGAAAFRAADVGKFIKVLGGLVQITVFDSTTQVRGQVLNILSDATSVPPALVPKGAWTLEVASWSVTNGYPRTGEFFPGRLFQAGTVAQPTTLWGSRSDGFDNYAVGVVADDAVEYRMASRAVNQIQWLAENIDLFIGTSGSEHRATSGSAAAVTLGGDIVPSVERESVHGCAAVQPVVAGRRTLFLDRSLRRFYALAFDIIQNGFDATEVTAFAEHITGTGVLPGSLGFQKRMDPRIYFINSDFHLCTLTYFIEQKVVGFTRLVTDGKFQSYAVIPNPAGGPDQVYVVVLRTINGVPKRYIELFEDHHESLAARAWTALQTHCAIVYTGSATDTITGLGHLEGKTVDVIDATGFLGTAIVTGGQIVMPNQMMPPVEIGLHYRSTAVTMRPAIEGTVIDGLPRSWTSLFVRVKDTIGGQINGQNLLYPPDALDSKRLTTGDVKVTGQGSDTDGRVTITQDQPYPMTVLAVFGTLEIGDHD